MNCSDQPTSTTFDDHEEPPGGSNREDVLRRRFYDSSYGQQFPTRMTSRRQRQTSLYSPTTYPRDFLDRRSMNDISADQQQQQHYINDNRPISPVHYQSLSNLTTRRLPPFPPIDRSFDFDAMNEVIQSLANNLAAYSGSERRNQPNRRRTSLFKPTQLRCSTSDLHSSFSNLLLRRPTTKSFVRNYSEGERYSRKVFLGGLPTDITESEIVSQFVNFGPLSVDWPQRMTLGGNVPPKGYAFIIFCNESSVQCLLDSCIHRSDCFYLTISSAHVESKLVQVKPWVLADSDHVVDADQPIDPRKTIFVGGVPRPMRASELAVIMNQMFGGVCYAGIDTDPDLKYPKGAARVAFSDQSSYLMAIRNQYVRLTGPNLDKQVEIKPYLLDDQMCDQCGGEMCDNKPAPYFCSDESCLQYYCSECWDFIHRHSIRRNHRPMVKESGQNAQRRP